jgi:hypothetical protein
LNMRRATLALALALAGSVGTGAQSAHVSVRATTAAISVAGGAAQVSATLFDASGSEIDGLVIEREANRTTIILVARVRPGARIEARVPSATDLRIEGSNGGPVTVRDVSGQLEIVNSNAGIVLDRVGGTVLASTSNGPIEATLHSMGADLPMSFLTSNGRIDLTLPASLKANLRMESDTGPITSDFELARIGGEPIERKIMRGGRLRTIMHGAVNGGGPHIDVRTENAPIVIRQQK